MEMADFFMYGFYALLAVVVMYASYRLRLDESQADDEAEGGVNAFGEIVPYGGNTAVGLREDRD